MQDAIQSFDIRDWKPNLTAAETEKVALNLEQGAVIHLPTLGFSMTNDEQKFYSPSWLNGQRKNISLEGLNVRGATGSINDLTQMASMITRYAHQATQLIITLFPNYALYLNTARTSYRPNMVGAVAARSWKKDDSRLHVDAFPSRPNHGERILRVFTNVNPENVSRVWRVGEAFEQAAQHFLPNIKPPVPFSASLLSAIGITKRKRSEYDHIMLHLHDHMKADLDYQKNTQQQAVNFAPGSTWICFSDQVLHAAMSGQYMFEQTFHLPIAGQYHSEFSPLHVLEKLQKRQLVKR
ncbi:MAG: Kdo hydroxylase family protein [Methylophilaceae bacterium]|nr:Kdo hydroxylase family protein [Methylophilaceae bacterium]